MNKFYRVFFGLAAALAIGAASSVESRSVAGTAGKHVVDLVTIICSGGLTPSGGFHSETHFRTDGSLWYSDNTSHKKAQIAPAELRLLARQIEATHFPWPQGKKYVTPPPSAYDGQDVIVTLHTPHGLEAVTNHQAGADMNAPVLKTVRQLEAKYLR